MDEDRRKLVAGGMAKAREKLGSAQRWSKEGQAWGDIVSRAYYAAFHAAQAMLYSEGLEPKSHHGVMTLFGLHFVKSGRIDPHFARYLKNLKDDREESDYEIFSTVNEAIATNALREASEFVAEAERYLKPFLA